METLIPQDYKFEHVLDSGRREEFETGSVRDTRIGKGRFDLIAPYSLTRLAQHYENGAVKYGDRNWERGQNLSRYLDSAMRHLVKYIGGSREEDHLAAVAWNVFSYIQTEQWIKEGKLPKELNDVPVENNLDPRAINLASEALKKRIDKNIIMRSCLDR